MPVSIFRVGRNRTPPIISSESRRYASVPRRLLIGVALSSAVAFGQSAPSSLEIPPPTTSVVLGHTDTGALAELLAHLKAVGATPWTGMQGTGQITYGDDTTSYNATLTMLGNTGFRLDADAQQGQFSIRINRNHGAIQEVDGKRHLILPGTAASGIFQFQLPRLANFPATGSSFLDRGMVIVAGQNLHRLTFEAPLGVASKSGKQKIVTTDLYFDSATHLLVKSANTIRINGITNVDFLREITYEDYRQVGSLLIPFRFTQTLNGQKQWTLQLSEVQLGATQPAAYFNF